jgi:hypothetical protein
LGGTRRWPSWAQHATSRALYDLRSSFLREQDVTTIEQIAARYGYSTIYTLVPDFFQLDLDHTLFPNFRYPATHPFHALQKIAKGQTKATSKRKKQ